MKISMQLQTSTTQKVKVATKAQQWWLVASKVDLRWQQAWCPWWWGRGGSWGPGWGCGVGSAAISRALSWLPAGSHRSKLPVASTDSPSSYRQHFIITSYDHQDIVIVLCRQHQMISCHTGSLFIIIFLGNNQCIALDEIMDQGSSNYHLNIRNYCPHKMTTKFIRLTTLSLFLWAKFWYFSSKRPIPSRLLKYKGRVSSLPTHSNKNDE